MGEGLLRQTAKDDFDNQYWRLSLCRCYEKKIPFPRAWAGEGQEGCEWGARSVLSLKAKGRKGKLIAGNSRL